MKKKTGSLIASVITVILSVAPLRTGAQQTVFPEKGLIVRLFSTPLKVQQLGWNAPFATQDRYDPNGFPLYQGMGTMENDVLPILSDQIQRAELHGDEADFLQAYREFLQQRADASGTIDWSIYARATAQRDRMPAWPIEAQKPEFNHQVRGVFRPNGLIGGQRWTEMGPNSLNPPQFYAPGYQYYANEHASGRVTGVAFASDPNIVYLSSAGGGVWKSIDAGASWSPLCDGRPEWTSLQCSCVAVDPRNPRVVYAGTGDSRGFFRNYGIGVMKSVNGGTTWQALGAAAFGNAAISRILIDPDNSNNVIVTTGARTILPPYYPNPKQLVAGGVFVSNNGGTTFNPAAGLPVGIWTDAAISQTDDFGIRSCYVIGFTLPGAAAGRPQVWRTDDFGATWNNITEPGLAASAVTAANAPAFALSVIASPIFPDTVYIMDNLFQGIQKSENAGRNWNNLTAAYSAVTVRSPAEGGTETNWVQSSYNYYLGCSYRVIRGGAEDVLYIGGVSVLVSVDGGATFLDVTRSRRADGTCRVHSDQQCFAVNPNDPNDVFCGGDGGLFNLLYTPQANAPAATDWAVFGSNTDLGIAQFYASAFHPTNRDFVLGGAQDNPGPFSVDPATGMPQLKDWADVGFGDGGFCAINPLQPNIEFLTGVNLFTTRTIDYWKNQAAISPPMGGETVAFIAPLIIDPNNPARLYAGTDFLHRLDASNVNPAMWAWTGRLGPGAGQRLTNAGAAGNASNFVTAIAVAPGRSDRLYTGSSDGAVWYTDRATAAAAAVNDWRRINVTTAAGAAVTRWVKSIVVDPSKPSRIWVAFSGSGRIDGFFASGIWRCDDVTAVNPLWVNISGLNLPDVPVNAIALDPDDPTRSLFVGTDVGVFYTRMADRGRVPGTSTSLTLWTNATQKLGLPNVMISDLKTIPGTGMLNAATFGRGIWRVQVGQIKLNAVKLSRDVIKVGGLTSFTVLLNGAAPAGGITVYLTSSNPAVAAVPPTITVNPFLPSKTISVRGLGVGQTTLTATYGGVTLSINLTVTPSA